MALSTTQYGYIIDPMVPFTDNKGKTIKNGFVRVFVAGSSTPVVTYRNFDGATNQDRIELDNSGRTKTSVIGSKGFTYKVCVYDKHHSQESPILTVDKVSVIGANITAGAGATLVTGLDGLTTKPDGFVDASVVGTDGYVALDHTLVTDNLDTDAKVTDVENDRYIPLLNDDVNDPDSKITLGRLWQWDLGKIKSLPTTITAFRTGDVIPVDGPSGTAKMSKDDLLRETAENAAASGLLALNKGCESTLADISKFRLPDNLQDPVKLKKIELASLSDAVVCFQSRKTALASKCKLSGFVTLDVDYDMQITLTGDGGGTQVKKRATLHLYENEKKYFEIPFDCDSGDNVSVFFNMRGITNGNAVFDRCTLEIDGTITSIDILTKFVYGDFTRTITEHNYSGAAMLSDIASPMIKSCRLDDDIFNSQFFYKITLSNVTDAILFCNTGANPQSVTNVKFVGMITSDTSYTIGIKVSPNTSGSDLQGFNIDLVANVTKYIELDIPFNSVDFTNLSVFFQMRGISDANIVLDRCYVSVNGNIYSIDDLNKFIFGDFTKSVESNNFRGCVGRDEVQGLNKLRGKDILVLGDSISDTQGTNYRYPYYIAQITGATQINYAVSSAGYAKNALYPHPIWGQADTRVCDMIERAHTNGITCDLVIMAAGTNDWDFSAPLGQLSDVELDTMETPSFYWYVAKAIKNLVEYYPMATYLAIIPLPRNQPNGSGNQHTIKPGTNKTLIDYCNAIKEVCYWFSIPYLDMMQDSNLHLESATAKAQWMPDGLHPSSLYASSIFAPMVINRFNELL